MKLLSTIALALCATLVTAEASAQSSFPTVEVEALNGDAVRLPDAVNRPSLVLVGFEREHEEALLSWVDGMNLKDQDAPPWWQLNVLGERSAPVRFFIEQWMKNRIEGEALRARTLSLYEAQARTASLLGLPDAESVGVLVVSSDGRIVGTAVGPFTEGKADRLREAIDSASASR